MHLPDQEDLPIHLLAACFNSKSTTYKYYWLLSILKFVEKGEGRIPKLDLFAKMIASSWYTINYANVSFGQQDKFQEAIEELRETEGISINEKEDEIVRILLRTKKNETLRRLWHFDSQVPHWFMSPWFPKMNEKYIKEASKSFENDCFYALYPSEIVINPKWTTYLARNVLILKHFCFWNLVLYLEKRNPNVPNIPNKLQRPTKRDSLANQRKNFWDVVINELGSVECIYTGEKLTVGSYAVEHFIPHAFVSHDLIWNLIPANASFNSSKSNKLPLLEKYFDPFFSLQRQAIEIVKAKTPNSKHLLEYLTIFPDLDEITSLPQNFTKEKFRDRLLPLVTIASNNGFQFMT
jgi:hypothetical protein